MPNARHALSVLARIARRLGQHCVWWQPYEPSSGAEACGVEHLSQTASEHCLRQWGMKPTVLDRCRTRYNNV
jgi:hypothetical protein